MIATMTPAMQEALDALTAPPPDLHPELAACLRPDPVFGESLNHPLVFMMIYHPHLAKFANDSYYAKTEAVRECDVSGDFDRAIFMHERPWRLQALVARAHKMTTQQLGAVLGEVWRDCEHPRVNYAVWHRLWTQRGVALSAMTRRERSTLAKLKQQAQEGVLTLWRGTGAHRLAKRGLSWTLRKETAVWFAQRECRHGPPVVWSLQPPPDRMLCYMDGRSEFEVVVDTRGLQGIKRVPVKEVQP